MLGNALLPATPAAGVGLRFLAGQELLNQQPWVLTLLIRPDLPASPISVPIDLRTLAYLPSACFTALALATPLGSWRRTLELLGMGLLILEPLLMILLALPLLSFLGGTGPVRVFQLGRGAHTILQILYRALVASPGMAYVIPLLLWLALLSRLGFPKSEVGFRISG